MVAGSAHDGGRSADKGDAPPVTGGGGGVVDPRQSDSAVAIRGARYRSPLRPVRHRTSRPASYPGVVDDEGPATSVRGVEHDDSARFAHGGPPHPGFAPGEAILIVAPSNRSRPAVLATDVLPDLHVIDPATRALPRRAV